MRGFTLLELLVVLAILVLLGTLALKPLATFRAKEALDASVTQVLSILHEARESTLASKDDTVYGVHFESLRVVLFAGATYSEGAQTNKEYELPSSVEISTINIVGGSNVVFERLTGETSNTGEVVLSGVNYDVGERTITIKSTGLANQVYE